MSANDGNDKGKVTFPKRAILWAGGILGAGLLPVLREGNSAGVSRLLALVFVASMAALATRHVVHIREGYYRVGMGWAMVCEFGTLLLWGLTAAAVITSENPQIPRLLICSAGVALVYFFSSARMEALRAKTMKRKKLRIRRATEVLRESRLWRFVCRCASQIDFEFAHRTRRFLSGPDSEAGSLSLLAAIVLFVPIIVALVAAAAILASTVFPIPLTPPADSGGRRDSHGPSDGRNEPGPPGVPAGPDAVAGECNPGYEPVGAPQPERSSLQLGWEEMPGVQAGEMEALGFGIAGCPGRARPIPGDGGAWFAPGYCGGELRAIVIAPQGLEHPVVLLEQAAEFVLPLIEAGRFVSAVDRFPVAGGDAYIVDSRDGSYVLIRDHISDGPVDEHADQTGCEAFSNRDVRYTIADPWLIEVWRAIAAISVGGVYPIAYAREEDGSKSVVFRSAEGIMATGFCSISTMTCEVTIAGEQIEGRRGAFIDEAEVKALAEG